MNGSTTSVGRSETIDRYCKPLKCVVPILASSTEATAISDVIASLSTRIRKNQDTGSFSLANVTPEEYLALSKCLT